MGERIDGIPGWWPYEELLLPAPYQNYRLTGKPPATGSYGLVFESILSQGDADILIALKFVRPPVSPTHPGYSGWITTFLREASAGIRDGCAYLARSYPVLDLRQHGDWLPLAIPMPFYPLDLNKVLTAARDQSRRLPPPLVAHWSRQLVWALQDMHRAGFVHRDVKPSNIMLTLEKKSADDFWAAVGQARIRLGDFTTICRIGADDVQEVRPDKGGTNWKAPELVDADPKRRQQAQKSPAQDIYSLGLVLDHLAGVTDGNTDWLRSAAALCLQRNPEAQLKLETLEARLSPDFAEHTRLLNSSGHQPGEHPHFTGREFVHAEFARFSARCDQAQHGGVFVVEAVAGVGKTALMTHWAEQQPARTAYYFRFRDGRSTPAAMPDALCRQLSTQHSLPENNAPNNPSDRLRSLLHHLANRPSARPSPQLLFIDGLDECSNPAEAVTYIPVADLPRGVFLIVSSRPPTGQDYLGTLVAGGAHRYRIDPESEANLRDLERYFTDRLDDRLQPGQACQLAQSAGGMFQLAVLLTAEMIRRERPVSPAEILERSQTWADLNPDQRMYAYYEETWRRILERLRPDHPGVEHHLNAFAQLLAAAQDWLDLDQTLDLLYWLEDHGSQRSPARWNPTVFAAIQEQLRWLVEESGHCWYAQGGTGYVQLRHQSMRDFFVSAPQMRAVRLGLSRMHADVGAYYLAQARERKFWPRVDPYGRFYCVRHLLLAGRDEQVLEAIRLLLDFDYLQATLGTVSPDAVEDGEEAKP